MTEYAGAHYVSPDSPYRPTRSFRYQHHVFENMRWHSPAQPFQWLFKNLTYTFIILLDISMKTAFVPIFNMGVAN